MNKWESRIVGLAVGIICPLLTFVAFWWSAVALHLYAFRLPLSIIITAALTGLSLGCLLDAVFLRRWVRNFYTANAWLMVAVYLGLCVIAVGFCMGMPVGTFLLGLAAGAYAGRRHCHQLIGEARAAAIVRQVAIFAASVTTAAALPIGLLALQSERHLLRSLEGAFGLTRHSLEGGGRLMLVGFLCLLLFVMQFWCSRTAGWLAFSIGPGDAKARGPENC
jgi:hypothetical protein